MSDPRGPLGAQHSYRRRYRTDWFRVLVDLQYADWPHSRVAAVLDVPLATLRGWKGGSEPAHENGHALLELWCEITGNPLNARPMTRD